MLDSTTRIARLSGRTLFRFTINIYGTQGALTRSDIEVLVSAVQEGVGQALDPSQPLAKPAAGLRRGCGGGGHRRRTRRGTPHAVRPAPMTRALHT